MTDQKGGNKMKKKLVTAMLGTMMAVCMSAGGAGSVFAAEATTSEAAESEIVSVKVNCSVQSEGHRLDTIEVKVKNPDSLKGIKAQDFTLEGKSYTWGSEKEDGFRSPDTHDFSAVISSVTVDGDTMTLGISDFTEKYFYVDSYTVTCSKNPALSFTKDQVTEEVTPVADDFEQLTKSFEGQPDLVYNLFTPEDTSTPQPLVLAFHGSGDQENTKANRVVTAWAEPAAQEAHPAYVLAPILSDQSDEGQDLNIEQAVSVVEDMIEAGWVDPDRVYVTGKSLGGGNTIHAAAQHSDLFAAALPLCPAAQRFEGDDLSVLKDMPIWMVQAANDMIVPIEGTREAYKAITEAGNYKAKMKEYSQEEMAARGIKDDKHHDVEIISLEDATYADWLFAQRKSDVSEAIDYIKVHTSVPARGQRIDTIEIYVNDPAVLEKIKAEDFSLTGKAYTWAGNPATGYRSDETHDFTGTITELSVDGNKLTLTVGEFPEKYFYVDSFDVVCASNDSLSFTKSDVAETTIDVADEFNHYSADRGAAFDYNLYAPQTDGEAVPLVLALHGSGDQMNLQANRVAEAWASEENQAVRKAFVLAPVFKDQSQEAAEEIFDESVSLIRRLIDLGMVDPNRVYVTGKSMGGRNTDKIYTEYNGLFAAAMPLCGGFPEEAKGRIENIKDKPIWILQGDQDPNSELLAGSRELYETLQELGNEQAKYHEFTVEEMDAAGIGYHDIEILVMEDETYMEWLFAQSLEN